MNDLVQDELKKVLSEWHTGKQVQGIALGHSVREVEVDGVRTHEHHVFRQKKTYAFVFDLIEANLEDLPLVDFAMFDAIADEKAKEFGLSAEERGAGVSLAWAALRRGWSRALSGFPDGHEITLKQETQA
jgi:hypothetical protein